MPPSPSSQGPFAATGVTTFWVGNAAQQSQIDTVTVTAVPGAGGATLTAQINGKSITYTTLSTDTTATAAAAWQALLAAQTAPPEFGEITWTVNSNVITATGPADGTPFTLGTSVGGTAGAAVSHSVAAGISPSDAGNAVNWIRNGLFQTPQDGDDVVLADSRVPLLYNLNYFVSGGVRFNSLTRWQSFEGSVGLPENNPAGYYEYRPTYLGVRGAGAGVALAVYLGRGTTGAGPSRERYDFGTQQVALDAVASGSAQDDYAIRVLGTSRSNVLRVGATSVALAVLPAEAAWLGGPSWVGPGGTLALGPGCQVAASAVLTCRGGALSVAGLGDYLLEVREGGVLTVEAAAGTQQSVLAQQGARVVWNAAGTLQSLTLQTGSIFDKSADARLLTSGTTLLDGDCQVLDPYNAITYTTPAYFRDAITAGPFTTGPGRNVDLS